MRTWMAWALAVAGFGGCREVEEVTLDLDDAVHRVWVDPFSEDLEPVFEAFDREIDEAALVGTPLEGEIRRLTADELAGLEVASRSGGLPDPSRARGLLFLNRFPCDPATFETLLTHADQNAIYEAYDAYARSFEGDREVWRAGDADRLDWTGEITASIPLVGSYTYGFRTSLRRFVVPETYPTAGEFGWITRNEMPEPAVWDREERAMPQDYQLEVFVPFEDDLLHIYAFWREMDLGPVGTTESEAVARITFDQLAKWDRTTARVCAEGPPPE
jgi:hypothetical protein